MCAKASLTGFGDEVCRMVEDSIKENSEALDHNVRKAGAKSANRLRTVRSPAGRPSAGMTPTKTGAYASGWRAKTERQGTQTVCTVYQSKKPGLTHLLEKGHAKFIFGHPTGEYVPGYPHIEPAYEEGAKELGL